MQYRGLKKLINGLDELYDTQFDIVKEKFGGSIPEGIYSEYFYPIEDERMEMDIQLVDVEEEFDRRGVKIM